MVNRTDFKGQYEFPKKKKQFILLEMEPGAEVFNDETKEVTAEDCTFPICVIDAFTVHGAYEKLREEILRYIDETFVTVVGKPFISELKDVPNEDYKVILASFTSNYENEDHRMTSEFIVSEFHKE